MFIDARKFVAAQQAFFAAEVHAGELDQPRDLFVHALAVFALSQPMAERVQRVYKNSMLIVHRLNAGDGARMRRHVVHYSPMSLST